MTAPDNAPHVVPAAMRLYRSNPNCVNPDSKGNIPVAVLATDSFDPADVDVSSALLDGAASLEKPKPSLKKDVNGDGANDLVLHFDTRTLRDQGSLLDGNILTLTGALLDGTSFEGSDVIYLAGGPNCF